MNTEQLTAVQQIPGWLSAAEARELHSLATRRRVLEVGSFCGRSTVAMALSAAHVHSVDPFDGRGTPHPQDTPARYLDALARFAVAGRVTHSRAAVEMWAASPEADQVPRPELVFLDADHGAAATVGQLEAVHRLLAPAGVVALHDFDNPGVRAACLSAFHRPPDRRVDSLAVYLLDGTIPGRTLHVVTPASRPENLPHLWHSVSLLRRDLPGWSVEWWVFVDRSVPFLPALGGARVARQSFCPDPHGMGNLGRNDGLDATREGWVWFLDDDNDVHPGFGPGLVAAAAAHPDAEGFVFDQFDAAGSLRLPARADAGGGEIDTAQFVFRRAAVGGHRWALDDYAADAGFFAAVAGPLRERGTLVAPGLGATWYNRLRERPARPPNA